MDYKCVSKHFDLIYQWCKMIQHNSVNANLSGSQVDKLKPATKGSTEVTLRFSLNVTWLCKWCN